MKIKTYIDNRSMFDHAEFKRYYAEREAKYGSNHRIMPHDQTFEKIKTKLPKRHIFDIEADPDRSDIESFTINLFTIYGLVKQGSWEHLDFDPEISRDLAAKFNVLDYCEHHEVEPEDFKKIETASFRLSNFIKKSLRVDEWRQEILEQLKSFVSTKPYIQRLSHDQIALIHVYRRELITEANKNEIAQKYGWNSPTSGEKIRQKFCYWQVPRNRLGNFDDEVESQKVLINKISKIKSVLPYIPDLHKKRPTDEINTLNSKLS